MNRCLFSCLAAVVGLAALCTGADAWAALPTTLAVDGAFAATAGGAAPDGLYSFTFSVYKDALLGPALWTEGPAQVTVKNGTFGYSLGGSAPLTADVLATGRFLGVTVGSDPELPRVALASVAFALRAAVAESLECTGCLPGAALKASSVTSDKIGFAYAGGDAKGGAALKALDLQCTGCVSVAEMSFDADVDLKDKKLISGGVTTSGTIAAKEFIGDGSKLSGISQPQGKCLTGQAVTGITPDGLLLCGAAVDASGLPADGLNEVSNNLISNQFTDVVSTKVPVPIVDHYPLGVSDIQPDCGQLKPGSCDANMALIVPNIGTAQKLTVSVDISNSDVSHLSVTVTDPAGVAYLLYDNDKAGVAVNSSWPDPSPTLSGDLTSWMGKNPKGKWVLKVVDSGYLNNGFDGQVNKWSINISTLSNQKLQVAGNLIVNGQFLPYGACPGGLVAGVCLASPGINGTFLASAKTCAAKKADICTDSQMWVLRRHGMLESNPNWTNSFADNDGYAFNELNGTVGDDHLATSNWQAPCCYNLTPQRATDVKSGGVRVVYVNNSKDTYWRNAAQFCTAMQADLCDKAQYWVIRKAGLITVPVWASDHSDNDNPLFEKGVGAVSQDPGINEQYGFACCATERADLTCPGPEVNGVCVVKVNNTGGDWNAAATDCATLGARVCSISQSAVLRDAKTVTAAASWTASFSDNDGVGSGNGPGVGVGNAGDDHPNSSVYGYACCL